MSETKEKSSLNKDDFPGNSNKEKAKEITPVVLGKATVKKKTFSQKAGELFIGEEIDNVWTYIVQDVVVPATKNLIVDMVSQGVNMIFFGNSGPTRGRGGRNNPNNHVDYSSIYGDRNSGTRVAPSVRNRTTHDFQDIVFDTRLDAENVLISLENLILDYGQATVADFYELCNITAQFTDHNFGWSDLSMARIMNTRGGFIIDLPRTRGFTR